MNAILAISLADALSDVSAGGIVSVVVIILSLVEIAPIRISPLAWIGKRINKATLDKVNGIEKKLDEHIAQSYRNKILNFQTELITYGIGGHTQEEWREIINACDNYEAYCKANNVPNSLCVEAIKFIKESFSECKRERQFTDIKQIMKGEKK